MKYINIYIQKIKNTINSAIVKVILISLATVIITIAIIASLLWHFRTRVLHFLALSSIKEYQSLNPATTVNSIKDEKINAQAPVVAPEETVVGAVKKAKPAVVSIVISKQVPKYDVSYQQQDNSFFPGVFFQTPIYTPNGTEKQQIGSGSGFIISADGLIVTNRHVVADTTADYEVQLNNGKKYTAKVLARDPVLDVALVKITATGLPYLELGDSDTLDVGESVIAIGNALGEYKNTVSVGVVSGLSRSVVAGDASGNTEKLSKVIQTDAAINPGNSGGPLLNLAGNVIGINVAVVQGSSNVGFALPINSVKGAINSVKNTGKISRPYVGIRYVTIDADLKAKNNLAVDYGILVARGQNPSDLAVIPGSPADKAGIVENDIITEADGQKINQDQDFANLIRGKKVGSTIKLKVISKGIERSVTLKLEQAPENM